MTYRRWSLTSRLVTGVMGVVISALVILDVTLAIFTRFEMTERLDNSLQEVAERLQSVIDHIPHRPGGDDIAWLPDVGPRTLAYQVMDETGHIILRSQNAPLLPFVFTFHKPGFSDGQKFRVYVAAPTALGFRVMVGEPHLHRNEAVRRAILISTLPLLLGLPVIWGLVRWSVHRAMRPLARLRTAMQARHGGNLQPIPSLDLPVELVTIQTATNTLLERLDAALMNERAFAASAAHELRNPLAALQAQAQLLARQLEEHPAFQSRANLLAERIRSFGHMVEKLLQLSRAGSGMGYSRRRFDLLHVLGFLCDEINASPAVGARIHLDRGSRRSFWVEGDMDAAAILLRNLIENAVIHALPATPVSVCVGNDGEIVVENRCRPHTQDMLDKLVRPFVRGGSNTPGSGLGLAIARRIAEQMDCPLEIRTRAGEDRFVVSVRMTEKH